MIGNGAFLYGTTCFTGVCSAPLQCIIEAAVKARDPSDDNGSFCGHPLDTRTLRGATGSKWQAVVDLPCPKVSAIDDRFRLPWFVGTINQMRRGDVPSVWRQACIVAMAPETSFGTSMCKEPVQSVCTDFTEHEMAGREHALRFPCGAQQSVRGHPHAGDVSIKEGRLRESDTIEHCFLSPNDVRQQANNVRTIPVMVVWNRKDEHGQIMHDCFGGRRPIGVRNPRSQP